MKMLVISHIGDGFYQLPDERRMVLMEATLSYVERMRKSGKFKRIYQSPGWKRTMTILDVESLEEATRIALENPLYAYAEMETFDLVDWDTWLKTYRGAYQEVAAGR